MVIRFVFWLLCLLCDLAFLSENSRSENTSWSLVRAEMNDSCKIWEFPTAQGKS